MPTKITVVMCKNIGDPECESSSATCTLDFDDGSLTFQDPETVQRAVHIAVMASHQALQEKAIGRP